MANLMTTNTFGNDLDQVLSAHLNILAISPQVKVVIFPTLLGIAKFTEHVQKCVIHTIVLLPTNSHRIISAPVPLSLSHCYVLTPEWQLMVLLLVMKCTSGHSIPTLEAVIPFGIFPSLGPVSSRHL